MFEDTIVEGMQRPSKTPPPAATPQSDDPPPPEPRVKGRYFKPGYDEYGKIPKLAYSPNTLNRKAQLHSEFLYYTSLFKPLAGAMTKTADRLDLFAWVNKLFGPEYHADAFREKRNRYLCSLCLTMMNDELTGIFANPPPAGALNDCLEVEMDDFPQASWEMDMMWDETMNGIGGTDGAGTVVCNFHDEETTDPCPNVSSNTNRMLDDEFAFYLYLCRPYAAMMPSADEKTKVSVWLQSLQMITRSACPTMKGMRNDYIQALLGCVYDLRTAGPFLDYPPVSRLYPLTEAARLAAHTHRGLADGMSREADEFLAGQSVPEEGAFCYIAVTGDVQETSIPGLLKQTKSPKTPPRTSLPLSLTSTSRSGPTDRTFDVNKPDKTFDVNKPDRTFDVNKPDKTFDVNKPDKTFDVNKPDKTYNVSNPASFLSRTNRPSPTDTGSSRDMTGSPTDSYEVEELYKKGNATV